MRNIVQCGWSTGQGVRRLSGDVIGAVVERLGDAESIENYGIGDLKVGRRITYDVRANFRHAYRPC